MNLRYWLRHPGQVPARLRYWWWERRNPDKPWLSPGAVAYLDGHLAAGMVGLEFGSGRSTAWFAGKLRHLTSVEHDPAWYARVRADLDRRGVANVDYRLIPLDHPATEPEPPADGPVPAYAAAAADFPDGSLDLVVVDGHYRNFCVRAAVGKLRPGGLLVVDDAERWADGPPVPAGWPAVSRTGNGLKETSIWRRPE